jgi:hypothetical protein
MGRAFSSPCVTRIVAEPAAKGMAGMMDFDIKLFLLLV